MVLTSCTTQEITGAATGIQQVQGMIVTSQPVNIQVNPLDDGPPPGTQSVYNMEALKALQPGQYSEVWLEGYYSSGDGGQGLFQWDSEATDIATYATLDRLGMGDLGSIFYAQGGTGTPVRVKVTGTDLLSGNQRIRKINFLDGGDYTVRPSNPVSLSGTGAEILVWYEDGIVVKPNNHDDKGRWVRQYSGDTVNARWFGAHPSQEDNRDALQTAASYAAKNGKDLYIPAGVYVMKDEMRLTEHHNGLVLSGELHYKLAPLKLSSGENFYFERDNIVYEPEGDFRVVDESKSTVLKKIGRAESDLDDRTADIYLIQILSDENLVSDIHLKNLAFNGVSSTHQGWSNLRIATGPSGGIYLNNIASYESGNTGIASSSRNVYGEDLLVYLNALHGLAVTYGSGGYNENNVFKKVEAHHNGARVDGSGGYGVDFSTRSDAELYDFHLHHNWMGFKTSREVADIKLKNGVVEDSFYGHGLTHTGDTDTIMNLHFENIISRNNAGGGFRVVRGESVFMDEVIAYNNGLENGYPNFYIWGVPGPVNIGRIVSAEQSVTGSFSMRLSGSIDIDQLEVYDNNRVGVEFRSRSITVNSGHIYNNLGTGAEIVHADTKLCNVKFGSPNDPQPYRQTNYEIRRTATGTLQYWNLDFTDSKVAPENRISVPGAVENPC